MYFDPENPVNRLCAQAMQAEGEGKPEEAVRLLYHAWNKATHPVEKLTAAHYIARHQKSVADKLEWDLVALKFATEVDDEEIQSMFPSLYLNVAKCYEDLNDLIKAIENYKLALLYTEYLQNDGYGNMITAGIYNGINRVKQHNLT